MRKPFDSPITAFLVLAAIALPIGAVDDRDPVWNETWTDKLKRDLFVKYDKFARPTEHFNTTRVSFDISFQHVSVNERKSTMTVNGWAFHTWSDEKLKWNKSLYGDIDHIHVGSHEVWQPDILLYNSGTANTVEYYGDVNCIVYHDGKVLWVPPAQYVALCDLDLRRWPFDTQVCNLRFGSWTFHGEQINLQPSDLYEDQDNMAVHNSEWTIVDINKTRVDKYYKCCKESYPHVDFQLTLKRNAGLYCNLLITPAVAVVFLILTTLLLSPWNEMKTRVCVITILTISLFFVYFGFTIPFTANPPFIVYFYSGCMLQVTLSLVVSVLIINMAQRPDCKPLPRILKLFLFSRCGKMLGLSDLIAGIESRKSMPLRELAEKLTEESSTNFASNITEDCDRQKILCGSPSTVQLEWSMAITAFDRISFIVIFVILGITGIVCLS